MKNEENVAEKVEEEVASQENISLESLSLIELKALAYDQIVMVERSQNNLKVINEEMLKRQQKR
jgi:hypothetical protein